MITDFKQAKAIQKNRMKLQKSGYAKAVRRFLKRVYPDDYQTRKRSLPVYWKPVSEAGVQ